MPYNVHLGCVRHHLSAMEGSIHCHTQRHAWFDLLSSRHGCMLIFRCPRMLHAGTCWSPASCFEVKSIDRLVLFGTTLVGSAADSSCMAWCKSSSCYRSQQARRGLKRQPYLPLWHKRQLLPATDDLPPSFPPQLIPCVLLTLRPWKAVFLSALEIGAFHTAAPVVKAHF